MGAEPIPHELLLRHAGFLRRLARDLVGDPAAADDAVQEVWLRALEKPPRDSANLRGWLRVVLTNLVRSKARGDSRRDARERQRALDAGGELSATSPTDETLLRSVTEAVLSLEEPLRTTVLQHYFQGSSAAVIAERDHLPVSTVKSRLQRALETLRVRMQRDGGDHWQASLIALTLPSRLGKGVLLVSLKTKLAVASIVILGAVFAYRGFTDSPTKSADAPANSALPGQAVTPSESTTTKVPLESDPKPNERATEVAAADAAGSAIDEPPETLFYGTLRDPVGKPLAGLWHAGVSVTDAEGRRRYADAKDSGAYAFNALPYGKYWVSAMADGFRSATDTVELDAEHAQLKKDLTLPPVPILKIRVTTPDGKSFFGEEHEDMQLKGTPDLVPVATRERPGKWFKEVVGSLNNPFGIGHFWQYGPRAEALPKGYMGLLMLDQELPAFVSLVNHHRVLQTKEVQPGEDEVHFVISIDELSASMGSLHLQVVDAGDLSPLKDAHVMLLGGSYGGADPSADGNGDILVADHEPGEFDLQVFAKGHEQYKARILIDSGAPTDLGQIALEKSIEVEIKVVDASGAPRNGQFALGVYDPSTTSVKMDDHMLYASRGEGVLALPGLGRHLYVVRTRNHDGANDQVKEDPKWVSGNVLLDLRSGVAPSLFVITLVPATRVILAGKSGSNDGLRFRVTDEKGFDLVAARFWGEGPRPLSLPQGAYKLALLDANKKVLSDQPLVVGAKPMTVELSR